MLLLLREKWFNIGAFTLLFLTVICFSWTGNYLFLAVPFAFLYLVQVSLNWKAAYWLFLFSIPASKLLSLAGGETTLTVPDQPMMILFLAMFILMFARNPRLMPGWWWRDKIVFIAVLQFVWLCVAVMYSTVLWPFSVKWLAAKIWLMVSYFVLPILVFNTKKDFKKAFNLTMVSMTITILIVVAYHATLGFKFDKVQKVAGLIYYNHVDYSAVMSMFLPLLLVAYPLTKGRSIATRWGLMGVILVFLVGLAESYGRAAWIGVGFCLVVGVAMRLKLVNLIMPFFYGLIILLMCYMVPNSKYLDFRPDYNNTYMHKGFVDHMIATFRGRDMSSMERLYRWLAAIRMSTDRPITGYGPHGFVRNYKPYTVSSFKTYVSRNPEQSTTHNYFLYMLTEEGWPGMLLYALLIPVIFAKAQRTYHRFKDKFYRTVTIGLAMTIASGFINNFFSELIETHKVGSLFYIPVALLIILDHKSRQESAGEVVE